MTTIYNKNLPMSKSAYLNIFNYKNDSIYQISLNTLEEPELTEFYLFSYSALEVFLYNNKSEYYIDLEKYGNLKSSMILTPSGLKIILVHKNLEKSSVKRILYKIHMEIKKMIINPVKYGFINENMYKLTHDVIERIATLAFKEELEEY